jgi:hypothetical protein
MRERVTAEQVAAPVFNAAAAGPGSRPATSPSNATIAGRDSASVSGRRSNS